MDEFVQSRSQLPAKASKADFTVWSFVKQCIGKDLTRISMPVVLNEPISFLQRIAEYMEYSELVSEALKQSDPVRRMEFICAFAVSATSSNFNRTGKPFNPLLGETYELNHNGFTLVSEQVSHHPPVTAFHVEAEEYRVWSTVQFKLRFWGKSIEVQPRGLVTLQLLKYNECYTWQNPNVTVHNVLMGKLWLEHVGQMKITNHTSGMVAQLEFHPSGWFSQMTNQLTGQILIPKSHCDPVVARQVYGNWARGLFTVEPHIWNERSEVARGKPENPAQTLNPETESITGVPNYSGPSETASSPEFGFDLILPQQRCIWLARPRPEHSSEYYNFTQFAIGLNELTDELACSKCPTTAPNGMPSARGFLPPTDSRFRPDIRALELGHLDEAAFQKNRLEEKQRCRTKLHEKECRSNHSVPTISSNKLLCPGRSSSSSCAIADPPSGASRYSNNDHRNKSTVVGPLWFKLDRNEITGQEEWLFTGDYWLRNWTHCPDLY